MTEKKEPIGQTQPKAAPKEKTLALTADFGTVYCRIQGDQIMRPVRADMTLYEKLGHFYKIWAGTEKDEATGEEANKFRFSITASGFRHLNKVAGISILSPQFVIVDGIQQPNPFVERDKRTRAIQSVILRKIGIGYSPAGTIVVVDKTLYYNIYTYFIQSIQAKMKKKTWAKSQAERKPAHPNAARIGTVDEKPEDRWAFFPTEEPLGIWVNYDDQAILDCLDEHTQRQRFGDRIAQTIVERNILKDHPAIGVSEVFAKDNKETGRTAAVVVYGYRHDMTGSSIGSIMRQVASGIDTDPYEVKAETIKVVDPEVEKDALAEEAKAEEIGPEGRMPPVDEIK
jgi:hypothetical protein